MKIDLHIHSKDCSDGRMSLEKIFESARKRKIGLISITDHDSLDCQKKSAALAQEFKIQYITGLELNVSFSHGDYKGGKPISLDFLAYAYDPQYPPLVQKLSELRDYRKKRAEMILERINEEFRKENRDLFTKEDLRAIEETVDGAFGRPHIANYLVRKGIVEDKQAAFDKYLVKCNVPKMPLSLSEVSNLVRGAGGKLMLAHPSDPNGTSLVKFTTSLKEQQKIIRESMSPLIDGIECWHFRHDQKTTLSYLAFARDEGLMVTGGSDCHQDPVRMGEVDVPTHVATQFGMEETL